MDCFIYFPATEAQPSVDVVANQQLEVTLVCLLIKKSCLCEGKLLLEQSRSDIKPITALQESQSKRFRAEHVSPAVH